MGNRRYPIIEGLVQGLGGLGMGLIEKDRKDNLRSTYDMYLKELQNAIKGQEQPEQQDMTGLNGVYNLPNDQTPELPVRQLVDEPLNIQKYNQGTNQVQGSPLDVLYKSIPKLMDYGQEGQNYINLLEGYYKNSIPKETEWGFYSDPQSGKVFQYNKNNPSQFQEIYMGEPKKEKKTKPSVTDLGKLNIDEVLTMLPNDIENSFDYFSPEVKTKLQELYPQFQPKPEKTPTGRRFRGYSNKGDSSDKLQKSLQEKVDLVKSGTLTPEQEESVNKEIQGITNKLDIKDKQEVAPDFDNIKTDLGLDDAIHSLYMIDTSTPEGLSAFMQSKDDLWNQIGQFYNDMTPAQQRVIYGYVETELKKIEKSKGF